MLTALRNVARARGMTVLAKETGLARESLYRALDKDGNPEFATPSKKPPFNSEAASAVKPRSMSARTMSTPATTSAISAAGKKENDAASSAEHEAGHAGADQNSHHWTSPSPVDNGDNAKSN